MAKTTKPSAPASRPIGRSGITITGMTLYRTRVKGKSVRKQGIGTLYGGMTIIYVKLATDAGIVGWGEVPDAAVFPGQAEANLAALHVYIRPLAIGADPFRIEELMRAADRAVVHCNGAKAAFEMALFDIVGQALKTPVHTLLGGKCRDEIPLSYSVANPDFAADVEMVRFLVADGVRIFKVKAGFADHREDLRRLETLRRELPADSDLRVDYNQGLPVHDAIRRIRDVEGFRPTFVEQPVALDQIAAMAEITRAIDTPIMADESVYSPEEALRVAMARAADIISIKVYKGGMLKVRAISAIAEAAGIPCYGGDAAETGVCHLAGAHVVAATPNISLGCEFYQATYYLVEDVLASPFPVRNGRVIVPDAPGLGIPVDEGRVRKMATETLG